MQPRIRYARTSDGVSIAYTIVGEGSPLVFARQFLVPSVDDEVTWPVSFWQPLADSYSVVLWDMRGFGLSDAATEPSLEDLLLDVDAVITAVGLGNFDLASVFTPCHVAMAYAARRPDLVKRLVLLNPAYPGMSPRSWQPAWLSDIARQDWQAYTDFSALFTYGWERAELGRRYAERLREHYDADTFARLVSYIESIDASAYAPQVRAPTLVIDDRSLRGHIGRRAATHGRRDSFMRHIASTIPGAELAVIKEGDQQAYADLIRRFLSGGRDHPPAKAALGSGTAVILFTDIVDSTALTERLGDDAFRAASKALDRRLREEIIAAGGQPVEGRTLGDGVLAVFRSARQAIEASLRCNEVSAETELRLHVGLHAGDVTGEDDNVYGGAVNIAARVCGLAAPGEVLVSDVVRSLARTSAGVEFQDRGLHDMKGVSQPQQLFAVRPPR